jgi:uncharacterized membrane protein
VLSFNPMDNSSTATTVAADPRHVTYVHVMYALHAASIVIGVLSTSFILAAFLFGWPSIIAIIMNYIRHGDVRDTWLSSHFRWQKRTFWIAAGSAVGASILFGPLVLILIGIVPLLLSYFLIGIWAAYRVVRGWLALNEGRPMPNGGA